MKSKRNQDSHRRKCMGRGRRYQLLAIGLVLLVCMAGVASAHYIIERIYGNNQVSAEAFYFTVDMLGDTNETEELVKEIHLYGGGAKTVTFQVQNYFDELRVTGTDITYRIGINSQNGAATTLKKDDKEVLLQSSDSSTGQSAGQETSEIELRTSGTVIGGFTRTAHQYELAIAEGYAEGTEVAVTIASQSPYEKAMVLTYVLHTYSSSVKWRVEDKAGDPYASLIIMTDNAVDADKIQVKWSDINAPDNILQVDSTSPYVIGNQLASDKQFYDAIVVKRALKDGESIEIRFFKKDASQNYSCNTTDASINGDVYMVTITEPIS